MNINWSGTRSLASANWEGLNLFCEKIDAGVWRWKIDNGTIVLKSSSRIFYPKSRAEAMREAEHYLNLYTL